MSNAVTENPHHFHVKYEIFTFLYGLKSFFDVKQVVIIRKDDINGSYFYLTDYRHVVNEVQEVRGYIQFNVLLTYKNQLAAILKKLFMLLLSAIRHCNPGILGIPMLFFAVQ